MRNEEKINFLEKHYVTVLSIAFILYSASLIIVLLQEYYSQIWYLKEVDMYLNILFASIVSLTLILSLFMMKNRKKLVLTYVGFLSLGQYIVSLGKFGSFYEEKVINNVFSTIYNLTFTFNIKILPFFAITIICLIAYFYYSCTNEEKQKDISPEDWKKYAGIISLAIIFSFIADIKNSIGSGHVTIVKYQEMEESYKKRIDILNKNKIDEIKRIENEYKHKLKDEKIEYLEKISKELK